MGKASRNKGSRGELQVRDMFRQAGFAAKRMVGQTRDGSDAPDIALEDLPDFWVESKLGKKPNIRAALEQAESAKRPRHKAIAVTRDDGKRAIVSMSFDVFAFIMRAAYPDAVIQPDLPGAIIEDQRPTLDAPEAPREGNLEPVPAGSKDCFARPADFLEGIGNG